MRPSLLLSLLLAIAAASLALADVPPSGRGDVRVVTTDAVPDGGVGKFHFVAVDDQEAPRFVFVSDTANHVIWRKDLAQGAWDKLTGESGKPGARDGPRGTALLDSPASLCANPQGQLVVADAGNACLRVVSPEGKPAGFVTTLAGVCKSFGPRDGPGGTALFGEGSIRSIACLANCSVLVADEANGRLRTVVVEIPSCLEAAAQRERAQHSGRSMGALVATAALSALAALVLAAAGLALVLKLSPTVADAVSAYAQGYRRLLY